MALKDSIFSNMKPASGMSPTETTQMAAAILDAVKTSMIHKAQRMTAQNSFQYNGYLITDDSRLLSKNVQSNKKGHVTQLQVTNYAESFCQALVSLARNDGISIGNYVAVPCSGSDDAYYFGSGIWSSPRFILSDKSERSGRCYALPLTREITRETFLRSKNDRIINSEGTFDSWSHPDFFLGLPISFHAVR